MRIFHSMPKRFRALTLVALGAILIATGSVALAAAPQPNPLTGSSTFSKDINYLTIRATGPAATIHGDPALGRALFAQNCAACHGALGVGGVDNPGSDDGTVPPVNPADPGFGADAPGDPANFAHNIDLFVQHGSKPSGDSPAIAMPGWGDAKKLTQQQIADVEAYIMQLNGVWWPDRWNPPAQVQMSATRSGNSVKYVINLVNEGPSDLTEVTLRDTLPAGVTFVQAYMPGIGQNPAKWNGSTVEWDVAVPQGGMLGPFTIETTVSGASVPANVAQITFAWNDINGDQVSSSAVSDRVVPAAPALAAQAPAVAAQAPSVAAQAPSVAAQLPAAAPTAAVTTTVPAATATPAPAAAPTAAPQPTAAPTAAPQPTTAPAPAGDATAGAALFTSKGCTACHTVNGTGGTIGPNLSHIGSTPYDSLANDPAFLALWLKNPSAQKPGTTMPNPNLSDTEIANLVAYLVSLK